MVGQLSIDYNLSDGLKSDVKVLGGGFLIRKVGW